MSYQNIGILEIANGAPVDTNLLGKIKNNLDDLNQRLINLETPVAIYTRNFSNPSILTSPIDQSFGLGSPVISGNNLVVTHDTIYHYHLNINQIPSSPLGIGQAYKIKLTISDYFTGFSDGSFYLWTQGAGLYPPRYFTGSELDAAATAGYIEINYTHAAAIEYLRVSHNAYNSPASAVGSIMRFSKIEFLEV